MCTRVRVCTGVYAYVIVYVAEACVYVCECIYMHSKLVTNDVCSYIHVFTIDVAT